MAPLCPACCLTCPLLACLFPASLQARPLSRLKTSRLRKPRARRTTTCTLWQPPRDLPAPPPERLWGSYFWRLHSPSHALPHNPVTIVSRCTPLLPLLPLPPFKLVQRTPTIAAYRLQFANKHRLPCTPALYTRPSNHECSSHLATLAVSVLCTPLLRCMQAGRETCRIALPAIPAYERADHFGACGCFATGLTACPQAREDIWKWSVSRQWPLQETSRSKQSTSKARHTSVVCC